ncbi:MAG: glycosyltransferase family 39 protein, partial [Candidatus Uhrbacteria bacterium]
MNRKIRFVIIVALAAFFGIGTSVLAWSNWRADDLAPRFHWPDETTNAYFTERITDGVPVLLEEARNPSVDGIIHPRTSNVRANGAIVPGGYLGLPIAYGMLGRIIGARAALFVTPVLAVFGLIAFALLIERFFGTRVGLVATALLALHPSMWLFTATTFLPNIPFVALLLIGLAILVRSHRWWQWGIGGLCIGLALTMRTHELIWVAALLIVVFATTRSKKNLPLAGALVIGVALPFIPVLAMQQELYGSLWTTGYSVLGAENGLPTEF